jgi:probable selenium-dependent hydroxylase accessory protein YqeC
MTGHTEALLDLLEARRGVVCAVGAGGKKSLLRRLALDNSIHGRVAITATVYTTYFQEHLGFGIALDEEDRLPAAVAALDPGVSVAYARPGEKHGRRGGVGFATLERIHREGGFLASYVKADGARMRLVKAPEADEPALPPFATTVIPVLSVLAVGEPLTPRIAHRVERVAQVAGLAESDTLAPVHLGRLLASPAALLKGTAGKPVVPVINMVDDAVREAQAREIATTALSLTDRFDRVVLLSLAREHDPVVAVIRR